MECTVLLTVLREPNNYLKDIDLESTQLFSRSVYLCVRKEIIVHGQVVEVGDTGS